MNKDAKVWIRAEVTEAGENKLSKIVDFASGEKVRIPMNKDNSIKWFDDYRLFKDGEIQTGNTIEEKKRFAEDFLLKSCGKKIIFNIMGNLTCINTIHARTEILNAEFKQDIIVTGDIVGLTVLDNDSENTEMSIPYAKLLNIRVEKLGHMMFFTYEYQSYNIEIVIYK